MILIVLAFAGLAMYGEPWDRQLAIISVVLLLACFGFAIGSSEEKR